MPKDKNIKVKREEHKKLRKAFGYDRKFKVEGKPYSRYNYLKKLSEIKIRGGDRKDENEKV